MLQQSLFSLSLSNSLVSLSGIVFLFIFVLFGIASLVRSRTVRECFFNTCDADIEGFNKEYYKDPVIRALFALTVMALIISKYAYLWYIRRYDVKKTSKRVTPSDYTLFFTSVGKNTTKEQIIEFISIEVPEAEVVKINFIYDIRDYYELINEWKKVEKQITQMEIEGRINEKKYRRKLTKKQEIIKEYFKLTEKLNHSEKFSDMFVGKCFVTFRTVKQCIKAKERLSGKILDFAFPRYKYKVKRAYEPQDYIWQNFGLTIKSKIIIRVASFFLSLCLILFGFFVTLLIKQEEDTINAGRSSN